MRTRDYAYKFGCGRYIQESGALKRLGEEALRLMSNKALIIGGPTALKTALPKIEESLRSSNVSFTVKEHGGACSMTAAESFSKAAKAEKCDLIIGVGGGRIMDLAKLVANLSELPIINVPTSAATCAAATPLSVMYRDDGAYDGGSVKHRLEVNAVIVDLDIMLTQPTRLLVAGAYDSMAKYIETKHRIKGKDEADLLLGIDYAYLLSEKIYKDVWALLPRATECLDKKTVTKDFERIIYILIGVTGIVSGIARGYGQTALAHELYETVREEFTREAIDFIHGEIVGMGLIAQAHYNGDTELTEELREMLLKCSLPTRLPDIGITPSEENLNILHAKILKSNSMKEEGKDGARRLTSALLTLI